MKTVIYHNPRCSKSRATLKLLQENGIEPNVVNYLETPPSKAQLQALCALLELKPQALIRFKESMAKDQAITPKDERSDDQWLELITQYPILLERPIVVVDDAKAALGRPPENVLAII